MPRGSECPEGGRCRCGQGARSPGRLATVLNPDRASGDTVRNRSQSDFTGGVLCHLNQVPCAAAMTPRVPQSVQPAKVTAVPLWCHSGDRRLHG